MRVLFMASPVTSHFTPMIPLAWALRSAGHEVVAVGQPDLVESAHAAGMSFRTVGEAFDVSDLMISDLAGGERPVESLGRPSDALLARGARMWIMHARYTAPRYLRFARAWRPDLIVADPMEFGALVVGGVLGVPTVHHRWGIDPISAPAWRPAHRALAGTCARLGLDRLPPPALVLDPCPAGLQAPGAAAGVPIRYVPHNGSDTVPGWALDRPKVRRVCVCLGRLTPAMNGLPLLRRVLDALASIPDLEALVALDSSYRDLLGGLPPSARLIDSVPLTLFLDTCDAVVHHGGSGTGMTASAFGLPQLVLPGFQDQFAFGDLVAACGAGITIGDAPHQNNAAAIRDAVIAVLSEPRYREGAELLRARIAAMPSPAALVPVLERLASSR
jgi:UDP:flavonoid glycosyltransferase YjiC (YdhE family)